MCRTEESHMWLRRMGLRGAEWVETVTLAEVRSLKLSISNAVFSANTTLVFFADFPRSFCNAYEFQNAEPASFVYTFTLEELSDILNGDRAQPP